MQTKNKKTIGITMYLIGIGIMFFWGIALLKIIYFPIAGSTVQGVIIGFKVSTNGASMVNKSLGSGKLLSGRSPFFKYFDHLDVENVNYSKSPQLFNLFNYQLNEKIKIAYLNDKPKESIIISLKEIPGLLFMLIFGLVIIIVGNTYLKK